ncbi:hypothetical protein NQ318_013584 [Aromia moschata]|uniref:Uncharacterized protein n=1 Tax=Aromia moschata TaxID=1265417 RepID=A0AAV8YEW1_9CUCU|nr:hypothetical protein NQ318_013584 [Aromia moschata]
MSDSKLIGGAEMEPNVPQSGDDELEGPRDMFIQSQQLATSSNSGAVQPKKRKTEQYSANGGVEANSGGELCLVDQVFSVAATNGHNHSLNPSTSNATATSSSAADLSHASPGVGSQQPFVRASTIKLVDTYQRCGQKRKTWSPEGNGNSCGEVVPSTDCTTTTTTAHSKVTAAPGG